MRSPASGPSVRIDRVPPRRHGGRQLRSKLQWRTQCTACSRYREPCGKLSRCGMRAGGHRNDGAVPAVPPARHRGPVDPHHPRGGGRVRAAGAALLGRQGLGRHAAPGPEGLLAGPHPLPGHARRHRPQLPRGARVPGPDRRRARRLAGRGLGAGVDRRRAGRSRSPAPTRRATGCRPAPCSTPSPSTSSTPSSAAPAGTRRRPGPRSGSTPSATSSASGTRRTSDPSCGPSTTAATAPGEHIRVFPLSDWTELDIWQYIDDEGIELPSHLLRPPPRGLPPRRHAARPSGRYVTIGEDEELVRGHRPLPHGRGHDLHRCRRVDRRHASTTSSSRWRPPGSPSGAPPGPTTGSARRPWRTASARGTSDGAAALRHRRVGRRRQEHPHRPAALRLQGDLRGPARGGRAGQQPARRRVHRPGPPDRRAAGRARAGHHHRRRLPLLRHARPQVHHRRHPRDTSSTPATWSPGTPPPT